MKNIILLLFPFWILSCSSSPSEDININNKEIMMGNWYVAETDTAVLTARGEVGIDYLDQNFIYSFFENDSLVFHVGFYDQHNRFHGFSTSYEIADNVISYYDPAINDTTIADIVFSSENPMVWNFREGGQYFLQKLKEKELADSKFVIDSISLGTKAYCELPCDEFKLKLYPFEKKC